MKREHVKGNTRERRAELVLGVLDKGLKKSAAMHAEMKVQDDLMIQVADDVLADAAKNKSQM
jgi:hypothetical protein